MTVVPPATLFGIPLTLYEPPSRLTAFLEDAWITNYARSTRALDLDLAAMKLFFDPVASGGRLREALDRIGPIGEEPNLPYSLERLLVPVGERRRLVRPEGRIVLEALRSLSPDEKGFYTVSAELALACHHAAAETYAGWGLHRLTSVVATLGGSKPLQAQPLGLILWLLVNRCTSERRAVPVRSDDAQLRRKIDGALERPVQAFAGVIARGGGARSSQPLAMDSGWQVTEAKRRLGSRLVIGRFVHVTEGCEDDVVGVLAHDLVRRKASVEKVEEALKAFQSAFHEAASSLAAVDLYHATSTETARVRHLLLDRVHEGWTS